MRVFRGWPACVFCCCLLLAAASAEASRVLVRDAGIAFTMPEEMSERALPEEAKAAGALFAAETEDGSLRLVLTAGPLRRKGIETASELADRHRKDGNVTVQDPVTVNGLEFILSDEVAEEDGGPVVFRMATAVVHETQITFFFIDRTGEHSGVPREVVGSVVADAEKETGI